MATPSSAPMAVFGCIGDVSVQTATAPVALGKKGVAICTVGSAAQPASASAARPTAASAAPLHIIIFQPSTRRPEFSTPLTSSFVLTLNDDDNGVWFHSVPAASEAPPPSAAASGKSSKVAKPPAASSSAPVPLLVQFSQREEQEEFCRAILLAKDQIQEQHYLSSGGSRSLLHQDSSLGVADSRQLEVGDAVKVKYAIFPCVAVHAPSPGRQVGKKLVSIGGDEPARVVLGGPKPLEVLSILEQAIVGMRKRGKRFVTVPFHLWSHEAPSLSWASDLPSGTTLYVELSVASVKFHSHADEVVPASPAPTPAPTPAPAPAPAAQRLTAVQPEPQPQQASSSHPRSSRPGRASQAAAAAEAVEDEPASAEIAPPPVARRATKTAPKRDSRFDDLVEYLQQMGLDEYTSEFVEQDIQLADLALLSETELSQIVTKIGPRRRLIASLAAHHPSAGATAAAAAANSAATVAAASYYQAPPPPQPPRSIPERRVDADRAAPIPRQHEAAPDDESDSLRGMQTLSREKALAYARAEFDRGAEEMLQRCRMQMTQLKETANARYREVEEDLAARTAENDSLRAAVARANRMLQDAHDRLQQSEADKAELIAQSKEWAGRVRAASHEQMGASLRAGMDQVFEQLSALIAEDQIYDGALVMRHIRNKMKAVTTAFLQSPSR